MPDPTPTTPGLYPTVQEDWDLLGEVSLETFFPGLIVYACAYECVFVSVCVERDWQEASVPAENLFLGLRGSWASLPTCPGSSLLRVRYLRWEYYILVG